MFVFICLFVCLFIDFFVSFFPFFSFVSLSFFSPISFFILFLRFLTENLYVCMFKVVKADLFDPESMVEGLTGQDAVLSCLGCPPSFLSRTKITFYTDSARTIVDAMRKASVNRFIFMSSWHSVCKY